MFAHSFLICSFALSVVCGVCGGGGGSTVKARIATILRRGSSGSVGVVRRSSLRGIGIVGRGSGRGFRGNSLRGHITTIGIRCLSRRRCGGIVSIGILRIVGRICCFWATNGRIPGDL